MSEGQFAILVLVVAALQAAFLIAAKTFIESAVKHQWDRRLEEFRSAIRVRERAALIAELLAEWDSRPDDPKRLNQLVLEANLWLPEREARNLDRILIHDPRAKFPKELIIDIRRLLRGEVDNLTADEIVYFPPAEKPKS